MNRKEYYDKLRRWEAEGYDVSELREKWFPGNKAGGEGLKWNWIAIALAIFIIIAGVIIWQVWPEPTRTVYVPAAPSELASEPEPASTPAPTPTPTPTPATTPTTTSPTPSPPEITTAQPLTLKFATAMSPVSSEYRAIYKPMLDEIEQASSGRIMFAVYPSGAAASAVDQYDAIASGAVDMGVSYFNYLADRFPLSGAFAFPAAYDMTNAGEDLIQALGNHIFALKPSETKILCFFQQQPYFLYTARKQVKNLDDLKGLKVRANVRDTVSLQVSTLESLEAVPIALSLADLHEAIQRGVIDGALATPSTVDMMKLTEITEYALRFPFGYDVGMVNINPDTWSKIPDDIKPIIENAAEKARYDFVQQFNIDDDEVNNIYVAQGGAVYTLSAAEQTRWANALKPAIDKWIADTEGKGWQAKDLVDTIRIECQKQGLSFPY